MNTDLLRYGLAGGLAAAAAAALLLAAVRAARACRPGLCRRCDYSLRELSRP